MTITVGWATDIHLDHLRRAPQRFDNFCEQVRAQKPDVLVLTGDIATADCLTSWLVKLQDVVKVPIRFVLGNHDFWGSSFRQVREEMGGLNDRMNAELDEHFVENGYDPPQSHRLWYLHGGAPRRLADGLYLIGEDGWYGMEDDISRSSILMNDWVYTTDFMPPASIYGSSVDPGHAQAVSRRLAAETALVVEHKLEHTFETFHAQEVILATHVPPFREASLYNGKPESANVALFSAAVVGQAILRVMQSRPDRKLTVLCGHSHDECRYCPLPNVEVLVGRAQYGFPRPQKPLVR